MSVAAAGAVLLSVGDAASGALFQDQMTSGAGWGVNAINADYAATFGYDYSADDIPEAPNSMGGDVATRGLKLEANLTTGQLSGVSLYPVGQNFTGQYRLRFDVWCNYDADERINGASAGTTEFIGGGIGYNGTASDVTSGFQMLATNDGGSGSDWRGFADGSFLAPDQMKAGDRNGFDSYYSDFLPGVAPPAGQAQTGFPAGTAGSPGFQWITMEFFVRPNSNRVIATIEKPDSSRLDIIWFDTAGDFPLVSTDGNISIAYFDFFSSVTSRPDLTFGIIDNVVVDVPTPGVPGLLGALSILALRRRRA
jgi:hypothetical protein